LSERNPTLDIFLLAQVFVVSPTFLSVCKKISF